MRILISSGASIARRDDQKNFSDISCFSLSRTARLYQPIDEPGASVDGESSYQRISLYWAIRAGETEIVSRFFEAGAGISMHLVNHR